LTLTVVDGKDVTRYVQDTINFDQAINDQLPKANFDVADDGCLLSFDWAMECILWDENSGVVPAHNLVPMPNVTPTWSLNASPLSGLFTGFPGLTPVMTFNNTTYSGGNNWGLATASSPAGYAHPGQSYMLSCYITIPVPLVNANVLLKLDFFDLNSNIIGASSVQVTPSSTTGNARQRISVQGICPDSAGFIKASFGGTASVSGTNSGSITFDTPQLEPMYFSDMSVDWNISYPTPDCT